MEKLEGGLITSELELYFAQQDLIGTTWSTCLFSDSCVLDDLMSQRTKTKLSNGEMQVKGDQWPIFLYADYMYDSEDPWNGLLRSGLLVSVSFITIPMIATTLSFFLGL